MTHCPRCGGACRGDAYCAWCGLALRTGPPPVPPPRAAPVPATSPPGTITAARVLLGISAAGFATAVLMAVVVSIVASSFGSAVAGSTFDDGTSATMRTLGGLAVVLAVVAAVLAGLEIWAIGAVGARRRSARVVVTLVEAADMVIGAGTIGVVGVDAVGPVLMSLPFGATLLVLLWVPENSRRWFDDVPPPANEDPAARTDVLPLPALPRVTP